MSRQKELFGIVLNDIQMLLEEAKANGVPISRAQFRKVAGEAARIHKSIIAPLDAALAEKSSSAPEFHDALSKVRSTYQESVNAVRGLKSALKNAPSLEVEASTEQTMQEKSGMPSSGNNQLLWLLEVLVDYVLSYLSPRRYELRLEELMASTKKASEEYTSSLDTLESVMMRYDRPLAAVSTLRQVARSEFFTQEIVLSSKEMVKASPPEGYEAGTQMPAIAKAKKLLTNLLSKMSDMTDETKITVSAMTEIQDASSQLLPLLEYFKTAENRENFIQEHNNIAKSIEQAVMEKYNEYLAAGSNQGKNQGELLKEAMQHVADEFLLSKFPHEQMDLLVNLLNKISASWHVPPLRTAYLSENVLKAAQNCTETIKSLKKALAFVDDIKVTSQSTSNTIADQDQNQDGINDKPLSEIAKLSNEDISSAIKQMNEAITAAACNAPALLPSMHEIERLCESFLLPHPIHKIEAITESIRLTLDDLLKTKLFTEYLPALRAAVEACPALKDEELRPRLASHYKDPKSAAEFDSMKMPLCNAGAALLTRPNAHYASLHRLELQTETLEKLCSDDPSNMFQTEAFTQLKRLGVTLKGFLGDADSFRGFCSGIDSGLAILKAERLALYSETLQADIIDVVRMLSDKPCKRIVAGSKKSLMHAYSPDAGLTTTPIEERVEEVPSANTVPSLDDMGISDTSKSPVQDEPQAEGLTTTPVEGEGVPSPSLSTAEVTQAGPPALSSNKG